MEINIHTLNEKVDEVVLLWKCIAAETVTQTRTQKYKEYNNKCIFINAISNIKQIKLYTPMHG